MASDNAEPDDELTGRSTFAAKFRAATTDGKRTNSSVKKLQSKKLLCSLRVWGI